MKSVVLKARAKINITLDVTGRRDDGYHFVKMIMQTISLYDTVSVKKVPKKGIWVSCDVKWVPCDERNLAYKAAKLIMDNFEINGGVAIYIHKRIPVSAGLAGGSTDCAAVLKAMNMLFELGLGEKDLMELGFKLGSDVPFCVMGGTALAEGLGEKLMPLPDCPHMDIVLVKLPVSVSTAAVYRLFDSEAEVSHPDTESELEALKNGDKAAVAEHLLNVLEPVTAKIHPRIEDIKAELVKNGALGAVMSGSGPTVYGIFADKRTACRAADHIRSGMNIKCVIVSGTENHKEVR